MKNLRFTYRMSLAFDMPVCEHYFTLRCVPVSNDVQEIKIENNLVAPADCLNESVDGFGNHQYVGQCLGSHDSFEYEVSGTAKVNGMQVQKEELHPMYRFPTSYTMPSQELEMYAKSLETAGDALEKSIQIMGALHRDFQYTPGSTDIHTTAADAWKNRQGVCQDYAHIMITLCRILGIPARYVNGLMIGEGYSHAWVEIYTGEGWYGLDPTNNLHVDDYYIKFAHGRDYSDCILDKGLFRGIANQKQEIYVNVEEI